jgi:hypothetical protein
MNYGKTNRAGDDQRGVPGLITYISHLVKVRTGAVVATGTWAGVALLMVRPEYLWNGDVMSVSIESIGELVNTVVDACVEPQPTQTLERLGDRAGAKLVGIERLRKGAVSRGVLLGIPSLRAVTPPTHVLGTNAMGPTFFDALNLESMSQQCASAATYKLMSPPRRCRLSRAQVAR